MAARLTEYYDLLAQVRNDGRWHSIRDLVRPYDPEVVEYAGILAKAPDFIDATHEFVHSFTRYGEEVGDIWRTPAESLSLSANEEGIDCDDSAILLTSLLRTRMPPNSVFCAVGMWARGGDSGGHMWVTTMNPNGTDRIIESTAGPSQPLFGRYEISALFNDQYTFATPYGLKVFGLMPSEEVIRSLEVAGAIPKVRRR